MNEAKSERLFAPWQWVVALQAKIVGERGAATVEYALLLTLVVVILIGSLTVLGHTLTGKIDDIVQQLQGA